MSEYVTISPEDVAKTLGTSPWWVREQPRLGRTPHPRLGKGRIRLLPEHDDALVALFTVERHVPRDEPPAAVSSDRPGWSPTGDPAGDGFRDHEDQREHRHAIDRVHNLLPAHSLPILTFHHGK